MLLPRQTRLVLFLLSNLFFIPITFSLVEEQEQFTEELLLKPLPDRKVLSHFHFQSRAPPTASYGHHHRLFPKAIYQLVHKYRIREMELSFTQGRWNYERWGGFDPISSNNAKPPGVELWAVFDVPEHQVDAYWKNLTHTLSGLFCASINFLESSTTYAAPEWGFQPFTGSLRYGTLPREAVCTENLTPWLKLLPCRDKAGLSALLDRPSIYKGFYHSQQLHLISAEFKSGELDSGIILEQTLTVVLQPGAKRTGLAYFQPSWSMSSIFGRQITGKCVLAKSSNVFLQIDRDAVSELKDMWKEMSVNSDKMSKSLWSNPYFELSRAPDRIKEASSINSDSASILYEFFIQKCSKSESFDLGLTWKSSFVWSCPKAPLHATRFLMGSGNERGSIAISLRTTELNRRLMDADISEETCKLRVDIFQMVPWYVKVYYHTLLVFVDEKPQALTDVIERMHVSPSEDKVSPGLMELALKLPCGLNSAALTVEFSKGFLHIDEYPPDANQGFDIPSAVISFPRFNTRLHFPKDDSERSPVLSYTEVLLVPLTTPDFSMPYNVITITCTVFALYFGSLLNVLRRRVGEEERILKEKAANKKTGWISILLSKLFAKLRGRPSESPKSPASSSSLVSLKLLLKVVLVASVAVGWQIEFLELCGFERIDGEKFLDLPIEKVDMAALVSAGSEL
ncbi:GPI transamidase component PIG-T [Dillenia turbinata]|uniref:GPI transamidase component PIG-T n=1 Tax=Dillenia turbinata TaxID=194707 RepID=A0AAN8ZED5_9MAGN